MSEQADTADQKQEQEETFEGKSLKELFPEERAGWRGYVEWERAPERKKVAVALLKTKEFTPIPGSSLLPSSFNYANPTSTQ